MAALPDGDLPVLAPIPGLVVKVLVAEGDMVEENQPMVLLEAMKMENELRAQKAGKVKQVRIVAGQRVEQNALLLLLE
jgi:biotin carboxyl carrier protein